MSTSPKNSAKTIELSVDTAKCTACGKCVKVCPSGIFTIENGAKVASVQYSQTCIGCSHCVCVCPVDAVNHSDFSAEKLHEIDYSQMPTPEQVMLLCKARRSNRALLGKAVSPEFLDRIVEAAHVAPTASNMQNVGFTIITDPAKLDAIIDFTLGQFTAMVKKLENPLLKPILKRLMPDAYRYVPMAQRMNAARKAGGDPILRGAKAVIFFHTPQKSRFGMQDCNLAYQNGSLMAESLGVSQIYTGFVCNVVGGKKQTPIHTLLGIKDCINAGMALSMPAFRYPKYAERKSAEITKFV